MHSNTNELSQNTPIKILEENSGTAITEKIDLHSPGTPFRIFSSIPYLSHSQLNSASGNHHQEIPDYFKGKILSDLVAGLEKHVNDSLSLPIEYLESNLYELCVEYHHKLNPSRIKISVVTTIHPITKLMKEDHINSSKWSFLLEKYILHNEYGFMEYKFLKKFVNFLNDLCLVWDIANLYNYRHRLDQDLEYITILDLDSIFSGIINIEIIWLSLILHTYPLQEIMNSEIKSIAVLLQAALMEILYLFMKSNKKNVKKFDSIKPWLSYKNINLYNVYSFPPPEKNPKPNYQELAIGLFNSYLNPTIIELKKKLEEFEFLYRTFEQNIILSLKALEGL